MHEGSTICIYIKGYDAKKKTVGVSIVDVHSS